MVLDTVNNEQGGMTDQEYLVCKILDFRLLSDERYSDLEYPITNAYHGIQQIFMSRVCIRLTGGIHLIKFDQPYDTNEPELTDIRCSEETHREFIKNLHHLYSEFMQLEPYHSSHRDDLIRVLREFEEILCKVEG